MNNKFFNAILSKIFHDLLSPISAVSLAIESVSESIDPSTSLYLNNGIEDFKTKIAIFKILLLNKSANIRTSELVEILNYDASKSYIQCEFNSLPPNLSADHAKTITHLYRLTKKAIIKNGTIRLDYSNDEILLSAESNLTMDIRSEINNILGDISLSNCTPQNADLYWAIMQIKEIGSLDIAVNAKVIKLCTKFIESSKY